MERKIVVVTTSVTPTSPHAHLLLTPTRCSVLLFRAQIMSAATTSDRKQRSDSHMKVHLPPVMVTTHNRTTIYQKEKPVLPSVLVTTGKITAVFQKPETSPTAIRNLRPVASVRETPCFSSRRERVSGVIMSVSVANRPSSHFLSKRSSPNEKTDCALLQPRPLSRIALPICSRD